MLTACVVYTAIVNQYCILLCAITHIYLPCHHHHLLAHGLHILLETKKKQIETTLCIVYMVFGTSPEKIPYETLYILVIKHCVKYIHVPALLD